ncbi:ATP-binding protein [candidate division KSB1 bacterium]|nr:ATP-binding protein [candidate division KSB1 bacterium]
MKRDIEPFLLEAAGQFPVIALTGPRQSGKSTTLQHLFKDHYYFTFDDPVIRRQAKDDPGLFIEQVPAFSILDEIQYVPEVLPYIKIRVDQNRDIAGQFLLTGSQIFQFMAGMTESLAGRVALFELLPFSLGELGIKHKMPLPDLFTHLYRGFYPDPAAKGVNADVFFPSYMQTYLERDIRQISNIQDLSLFQKFVELLAGRVASVLNLSDVARDCGISHTTALKWLSLLGTSRIIYLLRPYFTNINKRLIKSPKLYFTDPGLLAFLLKYPDSTTLLSGPAAGPFFESLIIIEFLKKKFNTFGRFELYFYRDSNKNEIDLVIDRAEKVDLVEIKMRKNLNYDDVKVLKKIAIDGKTNDRWIISCLEHKITIERTALNVPWWEAAQTLK